MAITNANSEIAGNMLEATGGNLQQAINLHMENSFNEPNTSHYNSSGIGDASAPIDQNKLVMYEYPFYVIEMLLMTILVCNLYHTTVYSNVIMIDKMGVHTK